jgi:hypothetical protein
MLESTQKEETAMSLEDKLDRLADEGGEVMLAPHEGQDLESFQFDVGRARDWERQGLLLVTLEHKESMSGQDYVDRLKIRLTDSGVEWRKRQRS